MRAKFVIPFLCIALGFNVGIGLAALHTQAYLPFVARAGIQPTITTLLSTDTSFVTAEVVPNTCRVILTYIDRANGNLLHVAEDRNNQLVDVPLPLLVTSLAPQASPEFVPPGPKQAFGDTVFACGVMHVYFTGRDTNDTSGPFKLKRIDMNIP